MKKMFFITGQMRSGTTLLANFINANAQCICYNNYLVSIFRISRYLKINHFNVRLKNQQKNIILTDLKAELNYKYLNDISSSDFETLKDLFYLSLERISNKDSKIIGVKVTEVEFWIEELLKTTDIDIIYIYRDLRDVLLSKSNTFATFDMFIDSKKWYNGISRILSLKSSRLFIIKFEDLITNPKVEIEKLSNFLGVSLNPEITALKLRDNLDWQDNSAFHSIKKIFDKGAIYRWKHKKNSPLIKYSVAIYSEILRKLGYEVNKIDRKIRSKYKRIYAYNEFKMKLDNYYSIFLSLIRRFLF